MSSFESRSAPISEAMHQKSKKFHCFSLSFSVRKKKKQKIIIHSFFPFENKLNSLTHFFFFFKFIMFIWIDNLFYLTRSFKPFGFPKGSSLNWSFSISINIGPIFFNKLLVSAVCMVKLCKLKVIIAVVLFPLQGNFCSSPHHCTLDNKISLNTIDTNHTE